MADAPEAGWTKESDELAVEAGWESWAEWVEHLELTTKKGKPRKKRRKICGRRVRGSDGVTQKDTPCCALAGAQSPKGQETGHLGIGACGSHGGLSDAGKACSNYKDGRQSRYRPTTMLADRYAQAVGGLDLDDDIKLKEAQIAHLVETLPEDTPTPNELVGLIGSFRKSLRGTDTNKTLEMLDVLEEALGSVSIYWSSVDRIGTFQEQKRKMVDTEVRRIAKEHGPVSWTDFLMIIDSVKTVIWDVMDLVPAPNKSEAMRLIRSIDSINAPISSDAN